MDNQWDLGMQQDFDNMTYELGRLVRIYKRHDYLDYDSSVAVTPLEEPFFDEKIKEIIYSNNIEETFYVVEEDNKKVFKISGENFETIEELQSVTELNTTWNEIASNGNNIVLSPKLGLLKISNDSGNTWYDGHTISGNWEGIAISKNNIIVAGRMNSSIFYITRDLGETWEEHQIPGWPPTGFQPHVSHISISDDGQVIALGYYGLKSISPYEDEGGIVISTDSGQTWSSFTQREDRGEGTIWPQSVKVSGSGEIIIYTDIMSGDFQDAIISKDSGQTWNKIEGLPNVSWTKAIDIGVNEDILLICSNHNIYLSTDGGNNWVNILTKSGLNVRWLGISIADDNQTIIAGQGYEPGRLHISFDLGQNWEERQPLGDVNAKWQATDYNKIELPFIIELSPFKRNSYLKNVLVNNTLKKEGVDYDFINYIAFENRAEIHFKEDLQEGDEIKVIWGDRVKPYHEEIVFLQELDSEHELIASGQMDIGDVRFKFQSDSKIAEEDFVSPDGGITFYKVLNLTKVRNQSNDIILYTKATGKKLPKR